MKRDVRTGSERSVEIARHDEHAVFEVTALHLLAVIAGGDGGEGPAVGLNAACAATSDRVCADVNASCVSSGSAADQWCVEVNAVCPGGNYPNNVCVSPNASC